MSYTKMHIYNAKFNIKTLQANCQRSSCKVHIFIKIQNEERKLKQIGEMKKNTAVFNAEYLWENIQIRYDDMTGTYMDTPAIISIHYETSQPNTRTNKLKIGQVVVNFGKLLNNKTYRINTQYNIQKCYDPNAKLKLAIDLTYVQDGQINYRENRQKVGEYSNKSLITGGLGSGIFKISKIREKMNEDQKSLLQNKIYDYEEKLEKYRDLHNELIKRSNEQMEKKQERINQILSENNLLSQNIQNMQIQFEKFKNKITQLEKDKLQLQDSTRNLTADKKNLTKQLATAKQELQLTSLKLSQMEQMKDKKQVHYKQQLQKYTQKYMESQNGRNKIVFELQSKLKEELKKKDQYYKQLISKLESKIQTHGSSSNQTITKKEKQIIVLIERSEKVERQRNTLQAELHQIEEQKQQLLNNKLHLQQKTNQLTVKLKNIEQQYEMCTFSNSNYQRQLQKLKIQSKNQSKALQQLRYEIDLANKTIQQQQQMIVKLNREIKTHKQRQYYMQQKFQDELQMKTYNQQCIKGSNNYYKAEIKKLQIKIKFLEEKIEDGETSITNITREKEKLQDEIKNNSKVIFENSHQLLRNQNQNKKLQQKCQELELDNSNKEMLIKELESKLNALINQREHEEHNYALTVNSLENQIKELKEKNMQEANQWEIQFENENAQKNGLLAQLQMELQRLRNIEGNLKEKLATREQKQHELEKQLREQKDKLRILERQAVKTKFQITKLTDQRDSFSNEQSKYKKQLNQLRNQTVNNKIELQKLTRKLSKQKQAYIELIKWILQRNYDNGTRQYIQQTSPQIEIQFISSINASLDRIYTSWQKNIKYIDQLRQENQKINEELSKYKLELKYDKEFAKNEKIDIELNLLQKNLGSTMLETNSIIKLPSVDVNGMYESTRLQEIRSMNNQLQREISLKNMEIQKLNEELFEEKNKVREYSNEIRNLNEIIEDLNIVMSKKTSLINSLQAQLSDRDMDGLMGSTYLSQRSPQTSINYRQEMEIKYKQQKLIAQLQAKVEEQERENSLQKSKITLLQGKLKSALKTNSK